MSNPELGIDPATLARRAAHWSVLPSISKDEKTIRTFDRLQGLDMAAFALGICDRDYWTEADRAIAIDRHLDEAGQEDEVEISDYENPNFRGHFIGYSKIYAGSIIEDTRRLAVHALCLVYDEALILPELKDDQFLHVPALGVKIIEPAPRAA
jgi:hypothetical protein